MSASGSLRLRLHQHLLPAAALVLLLCCAYILHPAAKITKMTVNGSTATPAQSFPVILDNKTKTVSITVQLNLARLHATQYRIRPDDCLDALTVNGREVKDPRIPYCDYQRGNAFDLSDYLTAGSNEVTLAIRNKGGKSGATFAPSVSDPLFIILLGAGLLISCLWLGNILQRRFAKDVTLVWIFTAGAGLRVLYTGLTEFHERAYDWDGHLEYIQYVAANWRIPPAIGGWEFHQPPLLYAWEAVWYAVGQGIGMPFSILLRVMQWHAALFSIATLFIGFLLSRTLFGGESNTWPRRMFLVFLAVTGSVVMLASRINNDVPAFFFGALALYFLMHWWNSATPEKTREWLPLCISLALGMLTKNSGLAMVAASLACAALHPRVSTRNKTELIGVLLTTLILLYGWLPAYRYTFESAHSASVVGNMASLNKAFLLGNNFWDYAAFNPLRILGEPYNNTYSSIPGGRYLWEFLYRSLFLGEFNFGKALSGLSSSILFLGFFGIPAALFGIWHAYRKRHSAFIPMLMVFGANIGLLTALRIVYPYSTFQDFRYIAVTIFPLAFFTVLGAHAFPEPWNRRLQFTLELLAAASLVWMAAVLGNWDPMFK